jgi:hypothetical protein
MAIELENFQVKRNKGWSTVISNIDLRSLGFSTSRLGKFDNSGFVQVTIGSTIQGQACGLNITIVNLISDLHPGTEISHTDSTNGKADKPGYPTFQSNHDNEKLGDFFEQLELAIVQNKT